MQIILAIRMRVTVSSRFEVQTLKFAYHFDYQKDDLLILPLIT